MPRLDLRSAARHQSGPGRDVEKPHPGFEAGPLERLAAVHGATAEIKHPADVVVVARGAVEQAVDERLTLGLYGVVRLQYGMGWDRLAHGYPPLDAVSTTYPTASV